MDTTQYKESYSKENDTWSELENIAPKVKKFIPKISLD